MKVGCQPYAVEYLHGEVYDLTYGCASDPFRLDWRDHATETCPRFYSWRGAILWSQCVDLVTWRYRRQEC